MCFVANSDVLLKLCVSVIISCAVMPTSTRLRAWKPLKYGRGKFALEGYRLSISTFCSFCCAVVFLKLL